MIKPGSVLFLLLVGSFLIKAANVDSLRAVEQDANDIEVRKAAAKTLVHVFKNNGEYDRAINLADKYIESILTGESSEQLLAEFYIGKASAYFDKGDLDSCDLYVKKAVNQTYSSDDDLSDAFVFMVAGVLYDQRSMHDTALKYYRRSGAIYDTSGEMHSKARLLNNESHALMQKGYERLSIEKLLEAKAIFDSLDMNLNAAVVGMNVGSRYMKFKEYDKALEYFQDAHEVMKESGNVSRLAQINTNLGDAHRNLGELDKAEEYIRESMRIKEENDMKSSYLVSLYSLAKIYQSREKHDEAVEILKQNLERCEEVNLISGIYYSSLGLAQSYLELGESDQVLRYAHKADSLAVAMGSPNLESEPRRLIYSAHKQSGDFEKALTYLEQYQSLNDSINRERKNSRVEELKIQYETERKEKENAQLKREALLRESSDQRQRITIIAAVIITALLLVLAIILYRYSRTKSKANKDLTHAYRNKNRQNEELRQLNEVKNKLLSIVGHDLKGPLGSISSILQLINQGDLSKGEQEELLKELEKQTNSTSALLENVMHWAKSQLEGFKVEKTVFNPAKSIEQVMSLFEGKVKDKELQLSNEVKADLKVKADANLFELVMRNLLSNAIKFTDKGGSVTISSEAKDGLVFFSVTDTGVGVPKEKAKQFFNKSFTMIGTGNEKGSGLGLMLCKEAVDSWGGSINAESEKGKGSVFTFTVPG